MGPGTTPGNAAGPTSYALLDSAPWRSRNRHPGHAAARASGLPERRSAARSGIQAFAASCVALSFSGPRIKSGVTTARASRTARPRQARRSLPKPFIPARGRDCAGRRKAASENKRGQPSGAPRAALTMIRTGAHPSGISKRRRRPGCLWRGGRSTPGAGTGRPGAPPPLEARPAGAALFPHTADGLQHSPHGEGIWGVYGRENRRG